MTDYVAWGSLIAAVAAAVVSIINAIRTPAKLDEVKRDVVTIHQVVNSRMTELLELTRRAAHAEGVAETAVAHPPQKG